MNAPEHVRIALARLSAAEGPANLDLAHRAELVATAQVHATLAVAQALLVIAQQVTP